MWGHCSNKVPCTVTTWYSHILEVFSNSLMCVLTKNCDGKHVKLSIKMIICLYRFDLVKNHGGTKFYHFFTLVQSTLKNIINVEGKS